MINRKFSRYYPKTLARESGWYDCGSSAFGRKHENSGKRRTPSPRSKKGDFTWSPSHRRRIIRRDATLKLSPK